MGCCRYLYVKFSTLGNLFCAVQKCFNIEIETNIFFVRNTSMRKSFDPVKQ